MSHSLYQFNTPQLENVVRALDFVRALFDNLKAGTISEAVARKAATEVIVSGDCAPTARLWTLLIENHDRNDLENISLIEPHDGPLDVKIIPVEFDASPRTTGVRKPQRGKNDPAADVERALEDGHRERDRAKRLPKSKAKAA